MYYNGTASETTIFVGGMLEKHTAGGIEEYRQTIQAGGQPVALVTRPTRGVITTQYFLRDHLGSVAEITNSGGEFDVAENFAAFGLRRDASAWSGPPSAADKAAIAGITQRGYAFHTNSEESSLIRKRKINRLLFILRLPYNSNGDVLTVIVDGGSAGTTTTTFEYDSAGMNRPGNSGDSLV